MKDGTGEARTELSGQCLMFMSKLMVALEKSENPHQETTCLESESKSVDQWRAASQLKLQTVQNSARQPFTATNLI